MLVSQGKIFSLVCFSQKFLCRRDHSENKIQTYWKQNDGHSNMNKQKGKCWRQIEAQFNNITLRKKYEKVQKKLKLTGVTQQYK